MLPQLRIPQEGDDDATLNSGSSISPPSPTPSSSGRERRTPSLPHALEKDSQLEKGLPDEEDPKEKEEESPEQAVRDADADFPEGGRGWWVVAGCSMIAAVTFGFQLVWGVFQEFYQNQMFPDAEPAILGLLGSIACGFMFPISVVCGKFGDR
ncbi:hypothetical protein DACRYDRAFT_120059 [Dacryopinax primogenitus]|uniref:Major facilitator superfamily (MFS) profile domain-containing protein n=1 Tax=Dacryopinax primogenitus (strain DJM 731) TaxID=1858805 RepID=M5FNR2_DACPD|nr:uncharacterized protein DACRYDRAFT_120059 [Dacryopinax primogenitus]EJT96513.1 hypothetical protein DACRYDRAFT_120059 [Dacryopinax primogenitus]